MFYVAGSADCRNRQVAPNKRDQGGTRLVNRQSTDVESFIGGR